jgi:hypothetical protein
VLSAVLAAAVVAMAGATLYGGSTAAAGPPPLGAAPHPTGTGTGTGTGSVELSQPATAAAIVAERGERVTQATSTDRRLPSRDGRPLDWLAVVSLAATGVAALWAVLARRRHRRVATVARWLAPARGPPLLLPS